MTRMAKDDRRKKQGTIRKIIEAYKITRRTTSASA